LTLLDAELFYNSARLSETLINQHRILKAVAISASISSLHGLQHLFQGSDLELARVLLHVPSHAFMCTNHIAKSILSLVLLAVTLPFGQAVALSYKVSGGSISANTGDGLIINTSLNLPSVPYAFNLSDGESHTFTFFEIWTPETTINHDDKVPQPISATLFFSDPLTNATVNGLTFGGSVWWGGGQWGEVKWATPAPTFTLGDRTFTVTLSGETFNFGLFGLSEGWCYGATVEATVKPDRLDSSFRSRQRQHRNAVGSLAGCDRRRQQEKSRLLTASKRPWNRRASRAGNGN
jgi:hypothetical protein